MKEQIRHAISLIENKHFTEAYDILENYSDRSAEALYWLSVLYKNGWGVDQENAKAHRLLVLSSAKGFTRALYELGRA